MHYSIRFETSKFDVTHEDESPVNPVWGKSLLLWLKDELDGQLKLEDPDLQDWGWITTVDWKGRPYQLGASAMEAGANSYEWVFQVDKRRSVHEKLAGKARMTRSDECLVFFKTLFESEPDFKYVTIE
jgi:hypothetical protein